MQVENSYFYWSVTDQSSARSVECGVEVNIEAYIPFSFSLKSLSALLHALRCFCIAESEYDSH